MNNLFITFEGGDGSGKSTQVNLLKAYLDNLNFETIKTREPGGTPSAEILRDLLTTGELEKWTPMSEALLMWASRYEHLIQVIEPALNSGKNVICDRFYDSTYAYQGVAHNLGIDKIGFDHMDRKILKTIIDKFKGGPVGLKSLSVALGEDSVTIEDVYEPFLIQQGFIVRTPRGREVTTRAYEHLGRIKNSQRGLF